MRSLLGTVILVVGFPFQYFKYILPFPCGLQSFCWKISCMGFPLYVTCCFSLAAFNSLSLCWVFVSLTSMCLRRFPLGLILYGTLRASWTWLTIIFVFGFLHLVWQSLGPSMLLQGTWLHSFLCLSSVSLYHMYICTVSSSPSPLPVQCVGCSTSWLLRILWL